MTTAQQFGDYYYDSRYSPPVSPKSLPHGYKRKASTQDDELERQNLISSSFKKLRLNSAKRASAVDLPPVGVAYRDSYPQPPSNGYPDHVSGRDLSYLPDAGIDAEDGGMMSIDDTTDRVWVHDLSAEIAEIEAEEAEAARNGSGIHFTEAGRESSKIPEYVLKQTTKPEEPHSNMQMILYKDPISISVPEEHDAVRKTIIAARRRMREKQAEDLRKELPPSSLSDSTNQADSIHVDEDDEDSMDID